MKRGETEKEICKWKMKELLLCKHAERNSPKEAENYHQSLKIFFNPSANSKPSRSFR